MPTGNAQGERKGLFVLAILHAMSGAARRKRCSNFPPPQTLLHYDMIRERRSSLYFSRDACPPSSHVNRPETMLGTIHNLYPHYREKIYYAQYAQYALCTLALC